MVEQGWWRDENLPDQPEILKALLFAIRNQKHLGGFSNQLKRMVRRKRPPLSMYSNAKFDDNCFLIL